MRLGLGLGGHRWERIEVGTVLLLGGGRHRQRYRARRPVVVGRRYRDQDNWRCRYLSLGRSIMHWGMGECLVLWHLRLLRTLG